MEDWAHAEIRVAIAAVPRTLSLKVLASLVRSKIALPSEAEAIPGVESVWIDTPGVDDFAVVRLLAASPPDLAFVSLTSGAGAVVGSEVLDVDDEAAHRLDLGHLDAQEAYVIVRLLSSLQRTDKS